MFSARPRLVPYDRAHGFEGKNDSLRPENTLSWNDNAEAKGA
jgi:hypothetical protein